MRPFLTTGENVVHLLYPLKYCDTKKIETLLKQKHWDRILHTPFEQACSKDYFFAEDVSYENLESKLIKEKDIISYFHPSIQNMLFHQENHFNIFGEPMTNTSRTFEAKLKRGYEGELSEETLVFEWLASEIYTFSANSAFLVVRLSLHKESKEKQQLALETWMKFVNRIRQNYLKYETQDTIIVKHFNSDKSFEPFPHFVDQFVKKLDAQLSISTLAANDALLQTNQNNQHRYFLHEPVAFTHAFMSTNFSDDYKLTPDELYQCIHLDDSDGESGGTAAFKDSFLQNNVYRRWENYHTYYTAIDYGAMSLINHNEGMSPLFQQHHCRHYLLFIVLQLYYREELQELAGRYARLTSIEDDEAHSILDDYYNMNQHFIFNRVSNEIQGREMWKFYYKAFEIDELYRAVNDDMKELNERNKEAHARKQEKQVRNLTVIAAFTGLLGMNLIVPTFDSVLPSMTPIHDVFPWLKNFVGIGANLLVAAVIIVVLSHISTLVPKVTIIILSIVSLLVAFFLLFDQTSYAFIIIGIIATIIFLYVNLFKHKAKR